MVVVAARFCSLLFVSLALAPGLAHLFELPNKIQLPRSEYFLVQQIYRGWSLIGVVVIAELASIAVLAALVHERRLAFALTVASGLCVIAGQAIFWWVTFPVNRRTTNWTVLPDNWMVLRAQWEYSHAAGAVLSLLALILLICSVLVDDPNVSSL